MKFSYFIVRVFCISVWMNCRFPSRIARQCIVRFTSQTEVCIVPLLIWNLQLTLRRYVCIISLTDMVILTVDTCLTLRFSCYYFSQVKKAIDKSKPSIVCVDGNLDPNSASAILGYCFDAGIPSMYSKSKDLYSDTNLAFGKLDNKNHVFN